MKRFFLFFAMLFMAFSATAQVVEIVLETSFSAVTTFFIPAVLASLLLLWADTAKHIKAGTYDAGVAMRTKIIPFLITQALAVAIYFLLAYLPFTKPFIEELAGLEIAELTAAAFVGTASTIVDALYKVYNQPKVA